jgi:RND family efflux transporter MFP subunit
MVSRYCNARTVASMRETVGNAESEGAGRAARLDAIALHNHSGGSLGQPAPNSKSMRVAAILFAAVLALGNVPQAHARKTLPAEADAHAAPQAVEARPLTQVALYPERHASAQVVALNEARIAAEISGRIEALAVEAGQTIARGALIARIDCRDYELAREQARAALAAAESRLALANQQLGQARALQAKGFVSIEALASRQTEVNVRRADLMQARAQLNTAEHAVGKCEVRAPFPAIVRARLGQLGELAVPGTPLATLIDTRRIEITAQVQLRDTDSLSQASEIRFEGDGGTRQAKLERISPAIDRQARTVEARLRFAETALPPGAQGRIAWRESRPHLPAELVVRREGRLGVFVVTDGRARFTPLRDAQEGRPVGVSFPAATRVVVKGQLALQDGAPVADAAR